MPPNFFEKRRNEMGLSQRKMATRLGVSNNAVAQWEMFRTTPTIPVAKLAEAYDVTTQQIERALTIQRRVIEAREAKLAGAGKE